MIEPRLADDALLADVASSAGDRAGDPLHVWWLGQSGYLLRHGGTRVLLDPYLSDSLTRKYAATDRPHVRMSRRVVDPARLAVDLVTSSHNHTDHLDAETLGAVMTASPNAAILIPEANREFVAERLACDPAWPVGLDDGERVHVAGVTVHGVAAAHEGLDRDEHGRHVYLGYVFEIGPWRVYHSGDTVRYPGMVERLLPHGIDLALLPINGRGPERGVAGNLWGREAAALGHEVGAALVVPCHYDMFAFNTASPDEFVETATRLGQPPRVLALGERLTLRRAGPGRG